MVTRNKLFPWPIFEWMWQEPPFPPWPIVLLKVMGNTFYVTLFLSERHRKHLFSLGLLFCVKVSGNIFQPGLFLSKDVPLAYFVSDSNRKYVYFLGYYFEWRCKETHMFVTWSGYLFLVADICLYKRNSLDLYKAVSWPKSKLTHY